MKKSVSFPLENNVQYVLCPQNLQDNLSLGKS